MDETQKALMRRRFARILQTSPQDISTTEAGGMTLFDFDYQSVRTGRVQSTAVYDPEGDRFDEMTVRFPPVDNDASSGKEARGVKDILVRRLDDDIGTFQEASKASHIGPRVEISSTGFYVHLEVEDIPREAGFELLRDCVAYTLPSWGDVEEPAS